MLKDYQRSCESKQGMARDDYSIATKAFVDRWKGTRSAEASCSTAVFVGNDAERERIVRARRLKECPDHDLTTGSPRGPYMFAWYISPVDGSRQLNAFPDWEWCTFPRRSMVTSASHRRAREPEMRYLSNKESRKNIPNLHFIWSHRPSPVAGSTRYAHGCFSVEWTKA